MIGASGLLQKMVEVLALGLLMTACTSDSSSSAPRLVASETIINPAPAGENPVAWNSVTLEDNGRTVVVAFEGGNANCYPVTRLVITPRNDVAVAELFAAKLELGRVCTTEAVGREERVTLVEPLPADTGFARAN